MLLRSIGKNIKRVCSIRFILICGLLFLFQQVSAKNSHPMLMQSSEDFKEMRKAVREPGLFQNAFNELKAHVDQELLSLPEVPQPKDGGGGYTHEKHKKNYALIYNAGILFQLTRDTKYAYYVRDLLLAYSEMYRGLPLHPAKKNQLPGKLFWQTLNETVWLVYAIQGYDNIMSTLTPEQRKKIEDGIFYPMVKFFMVDSSKTFNRVHNHGTWMTAAVGMAGYVLNEAEWVEKALYGSDKSGKTGFIKQLDKLFSPDGYYTEGPYYQRYALMPFVTFAKAIEENEPNRKIFQYRDRILLKAIDNTIQLSYNTLFFPINDAIKSKGIDTIELVHGVALAYSMTGDTSLLDIAKQQNQILLSADGLKVAKALDANKQGEYIFDSMAVGDGENGDEGALVIMRTKQQSSHQALVFKATAQGYGHGHFDKLSWLFYDSGNEILYDYGAARFLNVEAKYGGHYLRENNSYAKQSVAHNTVVVDETSHFNGKLKTANKHHPELLFFDKEEEIIISSATIDSAYSGVEMTRTLALVNAESRDEPFVIDVFNVESEKMHQYDLPMHYKGQLMDTNFDIKANTQTLSALGDKNGYQHLWLKGQAEIERDIAKVTWLNENRFYSLSTISKNNTQMLFTQLGANDPDFNLLPESAFILRVPSAKTHTFVNVLEIHGEYNPSKEFTVGAESQLKQLKYGQQGGVTVISVEFKDGDSFILALANPKNNKRQHSFSHRGKQHVFDGKYSFIQLSN